MRFFTAILYARDGTEIDRIEAHGMGRAKAQARHMLSERYAQACETTHADFQTMKAAIFAEGAKTGANAICEWDWEHPQHGPWIKERDRLDELAELAAQAEDAAK